MALLPFWKIGVISQGAFFSAWGETMGWLLRGWPVERAQDLFERLTEEQILPNLRPQIVACLRQHQAAGHLVALVSGTFAPWLAVIARHLELDHAIGTPLQIRQGRYTGRIVPPLCQGSGKPQRVQSYVADNHLSVDWQTSVAYADRIMDLPLLRLVGRRIVVHPDDALRLHAEAQGWPILDGATP
jgi:HAD superfamily hydrolase (TIGR01490 family)